jgi:BirA family biotin operon repressor/biotin-[acetyl-CoA-carboxylase] ligase
MRELAIINPFDAPVYYEDTVVSTMDVSRGLAAKGEPHGTVIAAGFQEAGRGRIRERSWSMDRDRSLPFTILLRYPRIENIPPALTLRTGLATALAIEDFAPSLAGAVLVKWPNDIMIRPAAEPAGRAKKAAGILTEADGGLVYIGIGINVSQNEFPPHLRDKAISISMAEGSAPGSAPGGACYALLERVLARLHGELKAAQAPIPDWRNRLEARLYQKGKEVCFVEGAADSGRVVEGRLAGIGPGGELLIIPKGKTEARSFLTGELRVYH